jgi:hypothetical protein
MGEEAYVLEQRVQQDAKLARVNVLGAIDEGPGLLAISRNELN